MKRLLVVLGGVLLASLILTKVASAADKMGFLNLGRAFSEYSKTKDYDKVLTDKENSYTADRDKRLSEFNASKDKFNLLSDKEKEAKKSEMEGKVKALKDFVTQKEGELRKEQEEKTNEILKDIESAVKSYSEKEGYIMIFNDRVLIYQNKNLDITDKIIDILNKKK